MRIASIFLLAPVVALAQASFPTTFPSGAIPLAPEALQARVSGKAYTVKPMEGSEYRVQFDGTNVYLDVGNFRDSGPWKVEGSAVCMEFTRAKSGCTEFRLVGDVLYSKRFSNGEVVIMRPQ